MSRIGPSGCPEKRNIPALINCLSFFTGDRPGAKIRAKVLAKEGFIRVAVRGVYTYEEKKIQEEARELIGKTEYVREGYHLGYFCPMAHLVATRESIRRYLTGMIDNGDPQWVDEEYARQTAYGRIIAPRSLYKLWRLVGGV